jgi:hypothetical protein
MDLPPDRDGSRCSCFHRSPFVCPSIPFWRVDIDLQVDIYAPEQGRALGPMQLIPRMPEAKLT